MWLKISEYSQTAYARDFRNQLYEGCIATSDAKRNGYINTHSSF